MMIVDMRCPIEDGPNELLGKIEVDPKEDQNMSVIHLICSWCTRKRKRGSVPRDQRAIHCYDVDGIFLETFYENVNRSN